MKKKKTKPVLGWREWVALPDLGIPLIKAKVDTGARTSALNAESMEEFDQDGVTMVRFAVNLRQNRKSPAIKYTCIAPVIDSRDVTSSGGHKEHRVVIHTTLQIGSMAIPAEITLTNRRSMKFPMLIGRSAVRKRYTIDPGRSYLTGNPAS